MRPIIFRRVRQVAAVATLDLSHQRAEAAIANGNVDTADHVAVFTPGFTSTVDGSMVDYDQNMTDMKRQSERILEETNPDAPVATVTWLGYQAPQMDAGCCCQCPVPPAADFACADWCSPALVRAQACSACVRPNADQFEARWTDASGNKQAAAFNTEPSAISKVLDDDDPNDGAAGALTVR